MKATVRIKYLKKCLKRFQGQAIEAGINRELLKDYNFICNYNHETIVQKSSNRKITFIIGLLFILTVISSYIVNSLLTARCLLPSNYLVWEATRPISDCSYCRNVTKPIILQNITREDFKVNIKLTRICS